MIRIGPVKFDGSKYSLRLDQSARAGKPAGRERKSPLQRTAHNGRSELVLVTSARKAAEATRALARAAEHVHREQSLRLPPSSAAGPEPHVRSAQPTRAKLVSRFLTWCFPVRDFNSPLQRILYLSMEGPRVRKRKRLTLR
jgi:hypothetical protein